MKAHRPTIMGTRHMIAATHYLAAEAGFRILEAGGNAIDAGVACGIALGVVQPEFVNVAGVAPIIIYSAADDRVFTIPGLGPWPKAIARDHFQKHYGGKIPQGVLRTVVPAAPDAWITALERFGTMSFGEVAQSAIGFARDGFPVYPLMSEIIAEHEAEYRAFPSNVALYLPKGRATAAGGSVCAGGARRHASAHGGPGDRGAPSRARGRARGGARCLLSRRNRIGDRQISKGEWRISVVRRSCELSFRLRCAGRNRIRRDPAICLRALVPRAIAAAGAQSP